MSSDENDCAHLPSSKGLRRSKRLAGSANESPRATKFHTGEGRRMRESVRRKCPTMSRHQTNDPSKGGELSCLFNGESLTSVELHQLFRKFTKDGHFRPNMSVYSPPPLVIAATMNDKFQTTKNGHGSAKKSHQRTDSTWHKVEMKENTGTNTTMDDSMSVTFANPLPNATGSTLRIATHGSQYVYTDHSSVSGPSATGKSGLDNCANLHKCSSALSNVPQQNMSSITSDAIPLNFSRPAKHHSLVRHINVYNPSKQLNGPENRNNTNTYDLNYPMNTGQFQYGFNMINVEPTDPSNPGKIAYNQIRYISNQPNVQSTQTHFNETQITQGFQTGDANWSDLTFPLQNESFYENPNDFWNLAPAGQIGSNSLASDPSILLSSELKSFSENITGYPPTSLAGYNFPINSFGNDHPYEIPGNGIAANTNSKVHASSPTTWNTIGAIHSHYTPESSGSCDNLTLNTDHSFDRCGDVSTLVNSGGHLTKSMNTWPQNNQARGHFSINNVQKHIAQTAIMPSDCMNITGTKDSCNVAKVTNHADGIANNKENLSFVMEDYHDSQNSDYCPAVSSICTHDNDIVYENYIDPKNANKHDHSVSTTTYHSGRNTGTLGALDKIKTELTLLHDVSNNYPYFDNRTTINSEDTIF